MSLILLATPFLKHHRGLLAFLPISIHWWFTIISLSPAAKLLSTWSSLACANHEAVPRPVQVFPSVELHDVPVQSLPQPIDVPLNGSTTLWWCLSFRFVSSADLLRVFTVIQVNINVNDFILIPRYTGCELPLTGICATDHSLLSLTFQPDLKILDCPLRSYVYEDVMGHSDEGLAKI